MEGFLGGRGHEANEVVERVLSNRVHVVKQLRALFLLCKNDKGEPAAVGNTKAFAFLAKLQGIL